jgi:pimeloyl-ACP methyl ester carboxylesterase
VSATDRLNQTINLADGRRLGFAEYGVQEGKAVFHCHGSGSSRRERPWDESILADLGIRFVATDRPGHGLSDPQPGRRLLDWPQDVSQLASHLGISHFYVTGWSAGGPAALACAAMLPDRVLASAIISGIAPPGRPKPYQGLRLLSRIWAFAARRAPILVTLMRRAAYPTIMAQHDQAADRMLAAFPRVDRQMLQMPAQRERFVLDIQEGYRQGWQGPVQDDLVNARPWGFRLEDIAVRVDIWQGDLDQNVPASQAHHQHASLPDSRLTIWKGEAHLALFNHWRELLAALIE